MPSLLQQLSAYTDGGHQDTHQRVSRTAGRRAERRGRVLPAGQLLHGPSGPDDPAFPALLRVVQEARPRRSIRPRKPASDSTRKTSSTCNAGRTWCGSIRWPSSKTPNWPSSATRAAAGRRRKSSGCLDKQMELLRQVVPLHRELLGARAGRADHDALLPSDPAAAVGQAAGAAGDAQRRAAEPSRRLHGGRAGAHSPGGRVPREAVRAEAAGHVALGRLGLPGHRSGHRRRRHPMDRHRRGNPLLLDRRLGRARRQRIPPQSRNALSPLARRGTRPRRCNWSSATTP